MKLENITLGARVGGLGGIDTVEVVSTRWIGLRAEKLLYRNDEPARKGAAAGPTFGFLGDGASYRLAAAPLCMRRAHLFDLLIAVHAARIEPLPRQLTAVYGELLPTPPVPSRRWIPTPARRSWPDSGFSRGPHDR